ncbi:hypothetical protein PRNP1_009730 [Phytophthora ramorum]
MVARITTLLLLLVAIAWSASVSSVAGEAPLAPADARLLRQQVAESVTTDSSSSHSSSSSSSSSGSGSLNATATINTEASAAETTQHEGPTTMSFVGPALAGVLAIVLIGAVVTFKNRMGK